MQANDIFDAIIARLLDQSSGDAVNAADILNTTRENIPIIINARMEYKPFFRNAITSPIDNYHESETEFARLHNIDVNRWIRFVTEFRQYVQQNVQQQQTKFNQLIRWFIVCETHPDEVFIEFATGLGITPHALSVILTVTRDKTDHNLEYYLLNEELSMAQQHQYVQTINHLLAPDRHLHGVLTHLNPDKWMCFMQTLHDFVHDPDPLSRLNIGKYYECVSRVSEETIPPPDREIVEVEDDIDEIGFGIAPSITPKKIARESAKLEIQELIRKMLTYRPNRQMFRTREQVLEQMITTYIAELDRKITAYLRDKTINHAVVNNLYKSYFSMFERTSQRLDDDRYWLDDVKQAEKDKIRIENSILDALAKLGGIKTGTGGKRSRSKKRGRKSIHRRKKSMHKKRK